jgi:hypothetical protein
VGMGSTLNPLMTILTNIRGGEDDGEGGSTSPEGTGARNLGRPVSARWRQHRVSQVGGGAGASATAGVPAVCLIL